MLDKQKLFGQLENVVPRFYANVESQKNLAYTIWPKLFLIQDLHENLKNVSSKWPIPSWLEPISSNIKINDDMNVYSVLSVDGSQVYPDRHQGISCYLLNIGSVFFDYGQETSSVKLESTPYLITDIILGQSQQEIVNAHRTELEFKNCFSLSLDIINNNKPDSFCAFLDCSLIFWHLDNKDTSSRENFINSYLGSLYLFYLKKIPVISYISLPKSKELINIIRSSLQNKLIEDVDFNSFDFLVDADILENFLGLHSRSAIFAHNSPIVAEYPDCLKPHFVYFNTGTEIARIEFPKWLAKDSALLDKVFKIIADQCVKGQGYPISLAESHEQAVISSQDREIFYQILYKISLDNDKKFSRSTKSIKKRFAAV